MASLNAAADSMQHSSARTKRHREREVGIVYIRESHFDYIQMTDSVPKRVRTGYIDLTSDDELERHFFLHGEYPEMCQRPEGEPSVKEMLRGILEVHHSSEADMRKLRRKNIKLKEELISAEDKSEERAMQEEKRHYDYVSAITNQALDITTGVCNISGKLVAQDRKLYIMEKCGAVSTRHMSTVISMLNTVTACVRGRDSRERIAMSSPSE